MSNKAKHPGPEQHGPEATRPEAAHDDDVILVPKGASKLRFLILLGLTILTLVLFTVGDQLMSSVGGPSSSSSDDVTWDGPLVGKKTWTAYEFMDEKRREDEFRSVFGQQASRFEDDELASELLIDELAQRSGIEVSTEDLKRAVISGFPGICPAFQSIEFYKTILTNSRVSAPVFESVLKRKLRIERYQGFLRGATLVADASLIEGEWKKQHPQYAFDLIEVDHARFDAEAKAAQLDEAGLKAWYDAIPDKRAQFMADFLPASNAAELIAYRFGADNTAAGLLAKFPLAADKDAEQIAKDYYNQYSSVRFVRATPLPEGLPESEGKDRLISSYEEVSAIARQEALVVNAFRAWVADLKARKTAGETIDLAAEAGAMGLSYRASDGAKTDAEWTGLADFGGPFMARSISGTQKDDFGADVAIDLTGITFPRVLEKNQNAAPPFEKVAEKATAEWLKQKSQELAVAKLTLIRDSFPKPEAGAADQSPKADEAAFKAAAEAQGLSVERRDWMTSTEQNNEPDASKSTHEFIRFNGFLRNLPADAVSAVQQDRTRTHSYLVRALGQREPPAAKLTPGDVASIQEALARKNFEAFVEANLSIKALGERYKLRVRGSKEVPLPDA